MASYNIYYLPYSIDKKVDYIFLFYLYGIAETDVKGGIKCIIKYTTIKELQDKINRKYGSGTNSVVSISKISRILNNQDYETFFTIETTPIEKRIRLNNNYCGVKGKSFVMISPAIYRFLIEQDDNFLVKYVIYLLYWCGIGYGQTDFTADQFLYNSGYNTKSNSQKEKICKYNKLLADRGIITIEKRFDSGKYRNTYTLKCV